MQFSPLLYFLMQAATSRKVNIQETKQRETIADWSLLYGLISSQFFSELFSDSRVEILFDGTEIYFMYI